MTQADDDHGAGDARVLRSASGTEAAPAPAPNEPVAPAERLQPGAIGRWLREGARTALFRAPRWRGLQATPAAVALLVILTMLLSVLVQRLYIEGEATLDWSALSTGWLSVLLTVWLCHLMRPVPLAHASEASDGLSAPVTAPSASHLFCLLSAQGLFVSLSIGVVWVLLVHSGWYAQAKPGHWMVWALWLAPWAWSILVQSTLLVRAGDRRTRTRLAGLVTLAALTGLSYFAPPDKIWYAPTASPDEAAGRRFHLTQDIMEAQPVVLAQRLHDIAPQRPGRIDLYAIGFAPYGEENVFRHESDVVTQVMAQRFDARGRTVQLLNHADTVAQWPWATPTNLRRAIQRMAALMDRDEDVLFIHLTSHGARDGQLAAGLWPMTVEPVRPANLKAWLDEAGVRFRVISISACYAGSWIAPLSGPGTLVMTASDQDHTSYGCGRLSSLTFFGRAMYDEELRLRTRSFEEAHSAARRLIKQREEEAGKTDGYSNPQISVGVAIKPRLAALQAQLAEGMQAARPPNLAK